MKPLFIAIEGGEGSGKSTLIRTIKEALGDSVAVTREPGGSPYGELIREAAIKNPLAKDAPPETTLCLMFASRFDHVANLVIPSLKSGKSVITDRFDASSYAYQISSQSSLLEDLFWDLRNRLAIKPDLYVFVDVDPSEGLKRARGRNQSVGNGKQYDHFDDRDLAFHQNVRKGFLKFFDKVKATRTPSLIIDANRPLEIVIADFVTKIKKQLNIK